MHARMITPSQLSLFPISLLIGAMWQELEAISLFKKCITRTSACFKALSLPKSSQYIALAKVVSRAARYCLSFTAAGLKPELAAVIARIYAEAGNWKQARVLVLERNALQTRSLSSAKRLESELRQRLRLLSEPQIRLLVEGSSDDRLAMAWLAALKRIEVAVELTRDLLLDKLQASDPVLRRSDMAGFYEACEQQHPELKTLSPSSEKKVRSALLSMVRDAGLLEGKANRSGLLGTVQRPSLSPQALALIGNDSDLRAGFLLKPKQRRAKR